MATNLINNNELTLYFDCDCHLAEHTIRITRDIDDVDFICFEFQLNQYLPIWRRLKVGIKYIFTTIGVTDWDSFILNKKDIIKLHKFLDIKKD